MCVLGAERTVHRAQGAGGGNAYAEGGAAEVAQDAVDRVVDAAVEHAPRLVEPWVKALLTLVDGASSLAEIRDALPGLYATASHRALGEHLGEALAAADVLGAQSVRGLLSPVPGPRSRTSDFGPRPPAATRAAQAGTSHQFLDVEVPRPPAGQAGEGAPFRDATDFFKAQYAAKEAFYLAGITKADFLGAVQGQVERSLTEGTPLRDFTREIQGLAEQQQVWGLTPARIETIYRVNTQQAYAGARYREMADPEIAALLPYWRYVAVMDNRTRPEHAAMHNTVYRADDPAWQTWYPPVGFGCRCHVEPLTAAELRARGLRVSTDEPPPDPEPGFGRPGEPLRALVQQPELGQRWTTAAQQAATYASLTRPSESQIPPGDRVRAPDKTPSFGDYGAHGLSRDGALDEMEADYRRRLGIPTRMRRGFLRDPLGEPVAVDLKALAHIARHTDGREQYLAYLRPTVEDPYEVWLTNMVDGSGQIRPRKRYIGVYAGVAGRENVVVIAEDGPFGLLWDAFQSKPGELNSKRKGDLQYVRA